MRFAFILLLATLVLPAQEVTDIGGNSEELIRKGLKRFSLEKGMIRYEVEGQPNDTLIVAFDRFGWREVTMEYGEKKYYGMKTNVNTMAVMDGESFYTINLMNNTGKINFGNDLVKLAGYKTPEEIFIARMSQLNATKTGMETLLGKECEVWQYVSRGKPCKLWVWKGLEIKHHTASNKKTATILNLDPTIPEKIFIIPRDIKWQDSRNN